MRVTRAEPDAAWRGMAVRIASDGVASGDAVRRVVRGEFTVPAGCGWQRLALRIAAMPGEAWIDAVPIARIR